MKQEPALKYQLPDPEGYSMDGYLKANLQETYNDVHQDFDAFFIVCGRERFGKSTLAAQIAYYLDRTFNLDRCVFTPEQYFEVLGKTEEKYKAIVFDEAHGYLNVRTTMTKFNLQLIKVMTEIGFKNLIHIFVLPNYFELDRYPALHRSTALLWVERRGVFKAFDYLQKWKLYIEGKKKYNMYAVTPSFYGRFTKWMPYDKEAYEKKKHEATRVEEEQKGIRADQNRKRFLELTKLLVKKGMGLHQIERETGIPNETLSHLMRTG